MNRFALLFSFLFFGCFAFAQRDTVEIEDQVYLTNGSFFRGKIIEWHQGEWLKLRTRDGLELQFQEARIRKVRQKRYGGPPAIRNQEYGFRERGLYNATSLALLPGEGYDNLIDGTGLSLSHSVGFQFNRLIGVGGGLSWDNYPGGYSRSYRFLPVFAEARGYFLRHIRTPYYCLQAGYGFAITPETDNGWAETTVDGGPFLAPVIGYRFGGTGGGSLTLDFGVRFQKGRELTTWTGGRNDIRYSFNRFSLRVGIVF